MNKMAVTMGSYTLLLLLSLHVLVCVFVIAFESRDSEG